MTRRASVAVVATGDRSSSSVAVQPVAQLTRSGAAPARAWKSRSRPARRGSAAGTLVKSAAAALARRCLDTPAGGLECLPDIIQRSAIQRRADAALEQHHAVARAVARGLLQRARRPRATGRRGGGACRQPADEAGQSLRAGDAAETGRQPQQGGPARQCRKCASPWPGAHAAFAKQYAPGIDQLAVGHAGRAGALAGAAAEAAVEVRTSTGSASRRPPASPCIRAIRPRGDSPSTFSTP